MIPCANPLGPGCNGDWNIHSDGSNNAPRERPVLKEARNWLSKVVFRCILGNCVSLVIYRVESLINSLKIAD